VTINVWVGVPDDKLTEWDDPEIQPVQDQTPRNLYRDNNDGPHTWSLRTVWVEDKPGWQGRLLSGFPTLRLLGAYRYDGSQVIPMHPSVIDYMPDIVTYDENGTELTRTRPTEVSDVNLGLGQSPREFTNG